VPIEPPKKEDSHATNPQEETKTKRPPYKKNGLLKIKEQISSRRERRGGRWLVVAW